MAGATLRKPAPLTVDVFRAFLESRPEEERWELIDGVATMMTPPTIAHQFVASNLQRLLQDGLREHAPKWVALQRVGVNLSPSIENYDPEPDVVVIDADIAQRASERYASRFYLAAEIVSTSDSASIDAKREIYKKHHSCTCVLTVRQERCEIHVDLRTDSGWTESVFTKLGDRLVIASFGLNCEVRDIYAGTAVALR